MSQIRHSFYLPTNIDNPLWSIVKLLTYDIFTQLPQFLRVDWISAPRVHVFQRSNMAIL